MKKILTFILFSAVITVRIFAVSAYPYPIEIEQPDGTKITILLKGDENVNWATSEDGYTLLVNKDGFYEYAILDGEGDLFFSGILAKNINERSAFDISFLNSTPKDLRYSDSQVSLKQQIYQNRNSWIKTMESQLRDEGGSGVRTFSGSKNFPVILVDFQGKPFTKTKAEFEALLNQPGYNVSNAPGSLRDYWLDASYGALDFTCDVYGPYTLSNTINYYDDACFIPGYGYGNPRNMARQAAQLAYDDGCDFSLYDNDNDGYVDGIHIIFAGYGQETGTAVCNSIWSHAWSFTPLFLNGKYLSKYSCSPELRGISGNNISHIGVIAHELGHVFGFPDFYDTDYGASGGNSVHLDVWCLMASGSWNDNGRTPSLPSAWCRDNAGWIMAQTISAPTTITLPNPQEAGVIYKINTTTNGEYFLVENRQRIGWDYYIPANGMLIYHVDRNYIGWNNNCINCDPSHRGCYLKQANCGVASTCLHNYTAYPGTTNNTSFTDTSIPNSKSWAGNNTGKTITNITHNTTSRTISFDFMGGQQAPITVRVSADPIQGGSVVGGGTYFYGESVTVSAIPSIGYRFSSWLNGSSVVSLYPNHTFSATIDITLVAHFENLDCPPVSDLSVDYTPNCHAILTWTAPPEEIMRGGIGYYHSSPTVLVYDNGPFITHFGIGANGADVSIVNTFYTNTLGFIANHEAGQSVADNFSLLEDVFIGTIDFYAYQPGVSLVSPITGVYVRIWNDNPMSGGSIIWGDMVTNLLSETIYSNANRVMPTTISNSDRKIFKVTALIDHELPAGSYWIEFSFTGDVDFSGPWVPPVTRYLFPQEGNAIQNSYGEWSSIFEPSYNAYFEMPFRINGVKKEENTEFYNVYRDGEIIALNIHEPFFVDTDFDYTKPHTWWVSFVCPESESQVLSVTLPACTPTASNNAYLEKILVSSGTLTPSFDPAITSYSVTVDCTVADISITGFAEDIQAIVAGNVSDAPVNIGSNLFTITVTAEDNVTVMSYTIDVIRNAAVTIYDEASICAGESYEFYGQTLTQQGIYYHDIDDCNKVELTFTLHPLFIIPVTASIFEGETYDFYGNLLTVAGVYNHTLHSVHGCDSIIRLSLSVLQAGFTITATAGPNGNINPNGMVVVQHGASITFTFVADPGYFVASLLVDGKAQSYSNDNYTFNNVRDNHTISVTFSCITITATAGPNGSITPQGVILVEKGGTETFTFTPDFGYKILDVLLDGKTDKNAIKNGFITIKNIKDAHTVHVTFEDNRLNIFASAGMNGSINPEGLIYVQLGGTETFTFTPYSGYVIYEVLVDGKKDNKAAKDGFVTLKNIKANHTVYVSFSTISKAPLSEILTHESVNVSIYSYENFIYINNEAETNLRFVEIYDMMGRVIYKETITNRETVIALDVAKGFYLVKLYSDKSFIVSKVAITK
ncbi:MAG: M6 family metalloprotease domain-containing protein [Bacteroidales bacterium]|nr:M6 family metalloprotease domain-containing protein [Bacteroidales bacterium]